MTLHRSPTWLLLTLALTLTCGPEGLEGDTSDGGEAPEVGEWSPCFTKDEFSTCDELCESEGKTCVAGGCPANPSTCTPDDCTSATVTIAFNDVICADATQGGFLDQPCDEPIGWQANSVGRCCCAD